MKTKSNAIAYTTARPLTGESARSKARTILKMLEQQGIKSINKS